MAVTIGLSKSRLFSALGVCAAIGLGVTVWAKSPSPSADAWTGYLNDDGSVSFVAPSGSKTRLRDPQGFCKLKGYEASFFEEPARITCLRKNPREGERTRRYAAVQNRPGRKIFLEPRFRFAGEVLPIFAADEFYSGAEEGAVALCRHLGFEKMIDYSAVAFKKRTPLPALDWESGTLESVRLAHWVFDTVSCAP